MCGGIKTLKRNILTQGRNDGGKGAQLSARRITTGGSEWLRRAPKSSKNVNTVHLPPNNLKFERQTCFLPLTPSNLVTPLCGPRCDSTRLPRM